MARNWRHALDHNHISFHLNLFSYGSLSIYIYIVFHRAVKPHELDCNQLKPIFHLATLFARREAKTRIRQRDWLKLAGEKIPYMSNTVASIPTEKITIIGKIYFPFVTFY